MSEEFFTFGQGDSHIGGKVKPWKAESGTTYRLSFAWWPTGNDGQPDLGAPGSGKAPLFTGKQTNFIQGAGYVINQGAEYTKLANEPPRLRIATILIIWPTDKKGILAKDRLMDAEIKPWVISGDKYKTLEQIHREFPFNEHDVTAKCEEGGAQFQKLTFSPCKENLFRQILNNPKAKDLVDRILGDVASISANINDHVGRKMTIQQIREKLANGSGAISGPVSGGDSGGASAGDIDNIVGGLLDE